MTEGFAKGVKVRERRGKKAMIHARGKKSRQEQGTGHGLQAFPKAEREGKSKNPAPVCATLKKKRKEKNLGAQGKMKSHAGGEKREETRRRGSPCLGVERPVLPKRLANGADNEHEERRTGRGGWKKRGA